MIRTCHTASSTRLPVGGYWCVAVTILLGLRSVSVAYVYIHPVRSCGAINILLGLRVLTKGSLIVCGDFNAHHPIWGSITSCKRCRQLAIDIKLAELGVDNGSLTFVRGHSTASAIDINFYTSDMPVTWRTAHDSEGSDHFPNHIGICTCGRDIEAMTKVVYLDRFRTLLISVPSGPVVTL